MSWFWISDPLVRALHSEQLAAHGGGAGVRDAGLLDSALQRPCDLAASGDPEAAVLAASLAYGIGCNHPFVDGNKRTAFVAGAVILEMNGYAVTPSEADVVVKMLALAAGDLSEAALTDWFAANARLR